MSQVKKEIFYLFGKKFVKRIKPDSIWWFTKITRSLAIGIAWATIKGDFWYDKVPGDRGFMWINRRELEYLDVREIYFGRLMIGFVRIKQRTVNDLLEVI